MSSSSDSNTGSGSFSKYALSTSQESMNATNIGLLGRVKEYGDSGSKTKRSRASYHAMQNPCCQVEGCKIDLKSAKDYHRRHRICEAHSKSPKVIVAGMECRFCQQCSRFHDLSEFDDKKRSCRRRLSDHNARRRRVRPDSIQLSSALYDQRPQNLLLNGLPISLSNTWENANILMSRQDTASLIRPSKAGGLEGTFCFPNVHTDSDKLSSIQSSNPRVLDQCLNVTATNCLIDPDLLSAHSLLSSNSWGEYSLMEGVVNGHSSPYQVSLLQTGNIRAEQGPHVSLLHSSLNLNQEYQLLKAPYHSGGFESS